MHNDGVVDCSLELKVDISTVAHVESWQIDRGVCYPECDDIVEEIIALANERPNSVTALAAVKRQTRVTDSQLFHGEVFFLSQEPTIFKPSFQS